MLTSDNCQKLLDDIYSKMEVFIKEASSFSLVGRRQYLSSAAAMHGYNERISEIVNSDDEIDEEELVKIRDNISQILNNLGIARCDCDVEEHSGVF